MPNLAADSYLENILAREEVDRTQFSPVRAVATTLGPIIHKWAGSQLVSVSPSGSFAKGTANKSSTDIDLFISLSQNTSNTLREIYDSLETALFQAGYPARRQNVSVRVKVSGYDVDLVPGRLQNSFTTDHSLYRSKADTWTKTNVYTHISTVVSGGRQRESRILKLWRDQHRLELPSFYLELTVIAALFGFYGSLSDNVWRVLHYLRDSFGGAVVTDPANSSNVLSDELTLAEKSKVQNVAKAAIASSTWGGIVQ